MEGRTWVSYFLSQRKDIVMLRRDAHNRLNRGFVTFWLWVFIDHGLLPTGLLCPWNSPGKNTRVHSHSLLQWIFPIQGSNLGLPHHRQILYHLCHQENPDFLFRLYETVFWENFRKEIKEKEKVPEEMIKWTAASHCLLQHHKYCWVKHASEVLS